MEMNIKLMNCDKFKIFQQKEIMLHNQIIFFLFNITS